MKNNPDPIANNNHYNKQNKYFDKFYSDVAFDYKLLPWHKTYISKITKYVLKSSSLKKKTLVDMGAGQGYVAVEMARKGVNVIACDMSKESIKSINRYKKQFKLPNIKAIKCLVEKVPLKDNSADYLIANAILEHIQDEEETIKEWKRILKPGGRMLVAVPLKFRYIWPFFWPINIVNDRMVGHLRRYDLASLKKKFGMKIVHYSYTGHALKVIWAMLALSFKTNAFAEEIEEIDNSKLGQKYGASNIVVVFQK